MKKIMKRTILLLILIAILCAGTAVYLGKFFAGGEGWASFRSNRHAYTDGILTAGTVLDRNGTVLLETVDGKRNYAEDKSLRMATLHAVGDPGGNIATGAQSLLADELMGYNFFKGAYSLNGKGRQVWLTIDGELNKTAYEALNGRKGLAAVYNYETGEVLCMVSTPAYDPAEGNSVDPEDSRYEGVYMNRFLSSAYVPGSIFKLVTLAAAIDRIPDLEERIFTCEGKVQVGDEIVACSGTHGEIDIYEAVSNSCNCAFAQLSLELGSEVLAEYAKKTGVVDSVEIHDYLTAKGNFTRAEAGTASLAWSGIGQHEDLVNPCSFLTYVGAIANGGTPKEPRLIHRVTNQFGLPAGIYGSSKGAALLSKDTAAKIEEMMAFAVEDNYGQENFPGLDLCAKSGTAQVGAEEAPHSWFTGFIRNEEHPLAFIVLVENGGTGSSAAGAVANEILQKAVSE
ncbi:MAG: penicillin-binding protein [Firmicutes bacterium]|nr:penicillin-binding protein [Bacillota bacterium]